MDATDGLADLVVGDGGDGTGVQNHQLRVLRTAGWGHAAVGERRLDRGPVSLGSPATEVVNMKAVHRLILAG